MEGEGMQTIEMCFNNTIEKHSIFKQAAQSLKNEIPSLAPHEIDRRCRELEILHKDVISNKEYLFTLMEFMGPDILDTAYIGEFQQALDKSIAVCNDLYKEILVYRNTFPPDLDAL
jgi:hypothetical protein